MSTPSKPTTTTSTSAAPAGRRGSTLMNPPKPATTPSRSPSRPALGSTPSATTSTSTPSRTKSVRTPAGGAPPSARAAVKKPVSSTTTQSAMEDAKAEAAAVIEDLRERLQKTELAAEESQKQVAVFQARLDEANKEHNTLEESVHEQQERMEEVENAKKESIRKYRELEAIYEAERAQAMNEKEEAHVVEDQLRDTIQRLKETIAQKDIRGDDDRRMSRASSFRNSATSPNPDGGQFAPPSSLQRSDSSRSSSRFLLQKDKIIESLRLELAEAQIKLVEMENRGGGRVQEIERVLMDTRVTNARLMEENESFQLLLSEKTLNGDFAHSALLRAPSTNGSRPPSREAMTRASTLADELEGTSDDGTGIVTAPGTLTADGRRQYSELSSLRDQNKALTLYINNIISRLLQHKEFENILDKTPNLMSGAADPAPSTNKDLPPPPPEKDDQPSLLQRATSVVRGNAARPQPIHTESHESQPSLNEDPATAPRIPLGRAQSKRLSFTAHRRSTSEVTGPAALVNNMYRGPSPATSGATSPSMLPARNSSLFSPILPPTPAAAARVPSSSSIPQVDNRRLSMPPPPIPNTTASHNSARNSVISESGDSMGAVSPPRSTTSSSDRPSGAIMAGNKMRPLRLVQETKDEDEAVKKANKRSSWMPSAWFAKGNENVPAQ